MRRVLFFCLSFLLAAQPAYSEGEGSGDRYPDPQDQASQEAMASVGEAPQKFGQEAPQAPQSKQEISKEAEDCKSAIDKARNACLESLSPNIQSMMPMLQQALSMLQAAGGSEGSCSQAGKTMDNAQKGLGAYNGACGAAKAYCNSKCGKATKKAGEVASSTCTQDAAKITDPAQKQQAIQKCQSAAKNSVSVFKEADKVCSDFSKNLAAGAMALAGVLGNMMQAKKCKDDLNDCSKNPNAPNCQQAAKDCNGKDAQDPQCICIRSPAMCGGNTQSVTNAMTQSRDAQTNAATGDLTPSAKDSTSNELPGAPSSGGGGLPGGGGGGGGGKVGGGMDGMKNQGDAAGKKLNTNINAGDYGGGGSGGHGGGGSGDLDEKYKAILDKNAKDRAVANEGAKQQISGGNGLSNWQKVRIRYTGNRQTLL